MMRKIAVFGILLVLVSAALAVVDPGHNPAEIDWLQPISGNLNIISGSLRAPQLCIGADCRSSWLASADTDWTELSGNVYRNTGNVIIAGGNLGVGNTQPAKKLDVIGDIRATGSVETSQICMQGMCRSSWATGGWIESGGNIYGAITGNVGIGLASPSAKLEVSGNIRSIGSIQASVDVCTSTKCLNSVGSLPACSAGQTLIAASAGNWVCSDPPWPKGRYCIVQNTGSPPACPTGFAAVNPTAIDSIGPIYGSSSSTSKSASSKISSTARTAQVWAWCCKSS